MIGQYVVTYPIGCVPPPKGSPEGTLPKSNRDIAEELIELLKNGGSVAIPQGGWKIELIGYAFYFFDGDGI